MRVFWGFLTIILWCPHVVMDKVQNCNLKVNSNSSHATMFTFRQILFRKIRTLLSPTSHYGFGSKSNNVFQAWTKVFHQNFTGWFNRDGFGIKYTAKVDMPLKKETKPNHYFFLNIFLSNSFDQSIWNPVNKKTSLSQLLPHINILIFHTSFLQSEDILKDFKLLLDETFFIWLNLLTFLSFFLPGEYAHFNWRNRQLIMSVHQGTQVRKNLNEIS